MTKFKKADFDFGSGSERFVTHGPNRRFIGRFKYSGPAANARHFVNFLIANFTVEEYFAAIDAGKTPLSILDEKGYVSLNVLAAQKRQAAAAFAARYAKPMILVDVSIQTLIID